MRFVLRAATLVAAGSWCAVAAHVALGTDVQEYDFNAAPAGQVQYSLDEGLSWIGVPLAGLRPFVGPGGISDAPPTLNPQALPPVTETTLLSDGVAFRGMSAAHDDEKPVFISSAFVLSGLPVGGAVLFRLLGNRGDATFESDPLDPIWDINNIQIRGLVEGDCDPEPGGLALVAAAAVSIAAWQCRSRRTRRRCRLSCFARRENAGPAASG